MGENTKPIPEWKHKEMEKADAILAEIVAGETFRHSVRDTLKSIAEGDKYLERPYGFGEGCYPGTKRKMFEDALYEFFEEDNYEESPNLVKTLLADIESAIEAEIPGSWKDVKSCINSRGKIEVSIDYDDLIDDVKKPIKEALKRETEEWIEETTAEIEQEAIIEAHQGASQREV